MSYPEAEMSERAVLLDRLVKRAREQELIDIGRGGRPYYFHGFGLVPVREQEQPRSPATTYPFLLRRSGRGRPVAHLIAGDGTSPLCGARLNHERWDVATVTRRRVCRRCIARRRRAQQEAQSTTTGDKSP